MFDIHIVGYKDYQLDILKAYFISNSIEYTFRDGCFCFYCEKVDKFFKVVQGLQDFYNARIPSGYKESIMLTVEIDENDNFCVNVLNISDFY